MSHDFWREHAGLKRLLTSPVNLLYRLAPRLGLSVAFLARNRYWPNLRAPRNLDEKIQWIKLYHRDPLYPVCGDKFAMRRYVEERGYAAHLVPLLWAGEAAGDIPFPTLPQRFVLKASHGCGYNILCRDKTGLDIPDAIRKLQRWQKQRYLECYGEWFYGVLPVMLLAEAFVECDGVHTTPHDYKVMCFDGQPRLVQVDVGRFDEDHYRCMYDLDWNMVEHDVDFPVDDTHGVSRPQPLAEILACAAALSAPFPFARVDFYVSGNDWYVGEITLTHGSGFNRSTPRPVLEQWGSWVPLPVREGAAQ